MTLRSRRLLWCLVTFAVVGVLAIPAVHWRLIGWWKGEAFALGRPVSYWRGLAADADMALVPVAVAPGGPPPPPTAIPPTVVLFRRMGRVDEAREWAAVVTGWDRLRADIRIGLEGRPEAVPVLILLLDDPDAKVRYYAAQALETAAADGRAAVPALRKLLDDPADIGSGNTVGKAAADAIKRIEGGPP